MKQLAAIALSTLLATGTAIADSSTTVVNLTSSSLHIATFDKQGGKDLSNTSCAGTDGMPNSCSFSIPDNTHYLDITENNTTGSHRVGISSADGFADKTIYCYPKTTYSGGVPINTGLNCELW